MLDGDSRTTIPSSGKTWARVLWTMVGVIGSVSSPAVGSGSGVGLGAVGLADLRQQCAEREADVRQDHVAHRRAGGLVGVAGDRDQAAPSGSSGPGM